MFDYSSKVREGILKVLITEVENKRCKCREGGWKISWKTLHRFITIIFKGWLDHLPWVLIGLRAAPTEDSALSSAEAVFGVPLAIPSQAQSMMKRPSDPAVEQLLIARRKRSICWSSRRALFYLGWCLTCLHQAGCGERPLASSYSGPRLVLRREQKILLLQMGNRQ